MKKFKLAKLVLLIIFLVPILTYALLLASKLFISKEGLAEDNFFPASGFLNIAHRGGAGIAPENTLFAFSNALEVGADVLEMDVHRTLDDELVVIHDVSIDRTTDKKGFISEMTLKQIQELDAGYRFKPAENFPLRGQGIKIPTLDEVLLAFPEVRMVIEIKPIKEEDFKTGVLLCSALTENKRLDKTLIASFSDGVINEIKEKCPGIKTISSFGDTASFLFLNNLGLAHLYQPKHTAFEIPMSSPLPLIGKLSIYSKKFLEKANEKNIAVHLWTINDEADMKKLLDERVQGILTDYPDKLAKLVGE